MTESMPIKDITPTLRCINLNFIVLDIGPIFKTKNDDQVRTVKVADQSGSINVSVWNEVALALAPGDICRLKNGLAAIKKSALTVNTNRNSEILKTGEFCFVFSEVPDMSLPSPDYAVLNKDDGPSNGPGGKPNHPGPDGDSNGQGGPGGPAPPSYRDLTAKAKIASVGAKPSNGTERRTVEKQINTASESTSKAGLGKRDHTGMKRNTSSSDLSSQRPEATISGTPVREVSPSRSVGATKSLPDPSLRPTDPRSAKVERLSSGRQPLLTSNGEDFQQHQQKQQQQQQHKGHHLDQPYDPSAPVIPYQRQQDYGLESPTWSGPKSPGPIFDSYTTSNNVVHNNFPNNRPGQVEIPFAAYANMDLAPQPRPQQRQPQLIPPNIPGLFSKPTTFPNHPSDPRAAKMQRIDPRLQK